MTFVCYTTSLKQTQKSYTDFVRYTRPLQPTVTPHGAEGLSSVLRHLTGSAHLLCLGEEAGLVLSVLALEDLPGALRSSVSSVLHDRREVLLTSGMMRRPTRVEAADEETFGLSSRSSRC